MNNTWTIWDKCSLMYMGRQHIWIIWAELPRPTGHVRVCLCAEMEAVAMFDYVARSPAELSFKVGELVILHSKASCDWWRGEVGGVKGLIPHKYISVLEGWVQTPAPEVFPECNVASQLDRCVVKKSEWLALNACPMKGAAFPFQKKFFRLFPRQVTLHQIEK